MTPEQIQTLHELTFNTFLSEFFSLFFLGLIAGAISLAFGESDF